MSLSADALYKMSDVELLAAYLEARRQFVEKKFTRDTHRARLTWIKARMFVGSSGGVTERNMAVDISEEFARKGQELREMTRDLDLLKVDVDIIAIVIRFRGAPAPAERTAKTRPKAIPSAKGAAVYPGTHLLARLSYPKRLILLAGLFAVPAMLAGLAYTRELNAKIAFSEKEQVGVRYVEPVTALLGKLVAARHDVVAAAAAGRPVPAPAIGQQRRAMAIADRELGAELRTTPMWNVLERKIGALTSTPPRGAPRTLDAYSETTAMAQALIVQGGNESNLILDPDLDSYYVMDAIITKLPALSDAIGRAGDRLIA